MLLRNTLIKELFDKIRDGIVAIFLKGRENTDKIAETKLQINFFQG